MHPADLERLVDAALKALPVPDAPRTLRARVMAAVAARDRAPWYSRPWLAWPAAWQAVSLAALAGVIAGGVLALPAAEWLIGQAASLAAATLPAGLVAVLQRAVRAAAQVDAAATAFRLVWRIVFAPITLYAAVVLAVMSGTCAAFASALPRVAYRKVLPQ